MQHHQQRRGNGGGGSCRAARAAPQRAYIGRHLANRNEM